MEASILMEDMREWLVQGGHSQQKSQQQSSLTSLSFMMVDEAYIEPVTQPFSLQNAEFLLNSDTANRNVLISIETDDNKSCQSWSSTMSQHEMATINRGEIEYHPILDDGPRLLSEESLEKTGDWTRRRLSQETLSSNTDSGFFNVPTQSPTGSSNSVYSQDSPYSSSAMASPQSSCTAQNFPDLYGAFSSHPQQKHLPTRMLDDLDLEQIVDDVDNLYREQLRKQEEEGEDMTENVVRRNLPPKKDSIDSYLSQSIQEVADQIDRNLEADRKKLGNKTTKGNKFDCHKNGIGSSQTSNEATEEMVQSDISNLMKCQYSSKVDVTRESTETILNSELSKLVKELTTTDETTGVKLTIIVKPKPKKKLSPAMQKRESLRRARNKNGILLSSLKKKIYHCNCIDCQQGRINQGKPAYLEPIDVENVDLGELPDSIPMEKKKSRGRPRKYPRLDDVMRYKNSINANQTDVNRHLSTENGKSEATPELHENVTKVPGSKVAANTSHFLNEDSACLMVDNEPDDSPLKTLVQPQSSLEVNNAASLERLNNFQSATSPENIGTPLLLTQRNEMRDENKSAPRPKRLLIDLGPGSSPKRARPCPLSAKLRYGMKNRPRLRPCSVSLEAEKAVCEAFIAAFTYSNSKPLKRRRKIKTKKPSPNPEFILRPPLRMSSQNLPCTMGQMELKESAT